MLSFLLLGSATLETTAFVAASKGHDNQADKPKTKANVVSGGIINAALAFALIIAALLSAGLLQDFAIVADLGVGVPLSRCI
jgi:hypothetical protein